MTTKMIRLARHLRTPLFVRTASATVWQLIRLGCQVAVLVLLARSLGPNDYGLFAGGAGLATAIAGLTGLGTGMLLVKDVASRPETWHASWSRALRMTLLTGIFFTLLFAAIAASLLDAHVGTSTLLCIAAADLLAFPIVYLCSFAFQAFGRIAWAAALPTLMAACRMAGATCFLLSPGNDSIDRYVVFHVASSITAAGLALLAVRIILKPRHPHGDEPATGMPEALRFCATWFTNNALGEFDKTLAVRFGNPALAATYAIAYRLASALATPVTALIMSSQPLLFAARHVERGRLAVRVVTATAAYALLACGAMAVIAPILPWVLGESYERAKIVAWMMVAFPLVFSLRFVLGSLLTAEGHPGLRAMFEGAGVLCMTALAALLVPRFGAPGLVTMTMASEVLVLSCASLALSLVRKRRSRAIPRVS